MRITRINGTFNKSPNFKGVKNKDIIRTVKTNNVYQNELYLLRRDASYEFINGVLTMVDSESTREYKKREKEYSEWLNSDAGSEEENGK